MTSNDWESRVLTDDELQAVLVKLGALEGMSVLQRQLELRSQQHDQTPALRDEVSNHLELGLTDFVPLVTEEPVSEIANDSPAIEAIPTVTANDIAGNLNALFASRQHVDFAPSTPLEIKPVEHTFEYAPIPLESDTKSFFIPTFANPLPDTTSVEVVTPIAQHTGLDEAEAAVVSPDPVAAPTPEPAAAPVAPTLTETSSEPQPLDELPDTGPQELIEIPSAEESVTALEEADTTSTPQPDLVDNVILSVGGQPTTAETPGVPASTAEVPTPESSTAEAPLVDPEPFDAEQAISPIEIEPATDLAIPAEWLAPKAAETGESALDTKPSAPLTGKSGFGSLLATWNGTGNLLFLIAAGFVAASLGFSLNTTLLGGFGALAAAGFGFGTAALSARRGRQTQATISRAAFGVRGAAVPLTFVILAKYAATAVATIATVFAVGYFYPVIPAKLTVAGATIDSFYLVLLLVLGAATILTILGSAARFLVTAVVAVVTAALAVATIALAGVSYPIAFTQMGSLNSSQALAFASVLIILLSVVWGTTAADETPDLRSDIVAPKLLAAGLISHAFIGSLAVLSGFAYFQVSQHLNLPLQVIGVPFVILAVLALSHQIRRSADSFSGFGLRGTPWWVVVISALLVTLAGISGHLFVAEDTLKSSAISLLPVAGVPVVAWLAIYGVDSVLRVEDYHEVSLLRDYGFYGKVRVANLAAWGLAVVLGLGFVQSSVPGFTWLGYLARPLGFATTGSQADTGVWVAFVIGLIAPLATIGKIRDQENEGRALLERHKELINVLGDL